MGIPTIQTALNGGEFSPELYGRTDLDKYRRATSTMRNFFASYRGGASTRGGTRFVGICKQGNRGQANNVLPPRNIPFQFSTNQGIVIEAGDKYFRFISNAGYITEPEVAVVNISVGQPAIISCLTPHGYATGDEVVLSNVVGPTGLNGRSFIITVITSASFSLTNPLDGSAVSTLQMPPLVPGDPRAARIYTLPTPYAVADVALLKFAQSADVMSIVHPSYPPYDLTRIAPTNWTLIQTKFASGISRPPLAATVAATDGATTGAARNFWYQFVTTAVDGATGQESVASDPGYVETVDQAVIAGSITIQSSLVVGASSYNFYQGPISLNNPPATGAVFGFVGSSYGNVFTSTNIQPDFSISPPVHANPFAVSPIKAITVTSSGSGYNSTTSTAVCISPTGDNAILQPVILNSDLTWISVINGGSGYTGTEPVQIIGAGTGASATITVGPSTGTYPSAVAYFQQRRFYANTTNNPDTYFASQPGSFTNFDTSLPVNDNDAIVGSPWSQQVNGIQWMVNMPGGLVILTGLGAWQLSGGATGIATASAVTPSNQVANPQAYNGVSPLVPPIIINYDILYVQNRGSIVRNLSYNYFVNIYTGTDMTVLSNHLFQDHLILQWAFAEEPHKLVWAVRDDGILLCLTYLKEQEVYAWSRHDTNGLFQSVCTIEEPPVNAPYFVVKRLIQNHGNPVWVYMQERMDDRVWDDLIDVWCVDAGLSYPQNQPNATLMLNSAVGVPTLMPPNVLYGGAGYSAGTFAEVVDETGSGANIALTVVDGVVTAAFLSGTLTGYTQPEVRIVDPLGTGGNGKIQLLAENLSTVIATAPVFSAKPGFGVIGDVIRTVQDGIAEVVNRASSTQLTVRITRPFPAIPNDPQKTGAPVKAGDWMIAAPTTVLRGLDHLEGMEVAILADGNVVAPQTVTNGAITLPEPATYAVVGLGFTAQLQTLYLDLPGPVTVQGRRKELDQVVVRVTQTIMPFEVGANQPDAAVRLSQSDSDWQNMTQAEGPFGSEVPLQPFDMVTGDVYAIPFDQLGNDKGQLAIQQTQPLPLTVVAAMPWVRVMDDVDA